MKFFLLEHGPRGADKVPLSVDRPHRGCVRVACDECGTTGVKPARVDVAIKVVDVGPLQDLEQVFTTLLVSQRVRMAIREGGLTGGDCRPVLYFKPASKQDGITEVVRQCQEDFRYEAFWAAGSGGSIADSSNVHLVKKCDACGWEEWSLPEEGVFIDEAQWDGSDFFQVKELPGPVFMTERAVGVLAGAGLSNFQAKPAEEHRPGQL